MYLRGGDDAYGYFSINARFTKWSLVKCSLIQVRRNIDIQRRMICLASRLKYVSAFQKCAFRWHGELMWHVIYSRSILIWICLERQEELAFLQSTRSDFASALDSLAIIWCHGQEILHAPRKSSQVLRFLVSSSWFSLNLWRVWLFFILFSCRLRMLEPDPSKRATVEELLQDPWLNEIEEDDDMVLYRERKNRSATPVTPANDAWYLSFYRILLSLNTFLTGHFEYTTRPTSNFFLIYAIAHSVYCITFNLGIKFRQCFLLQIASMSQSSWGSSTIKI